ncbi:hypothetical protein TRFO_26964 [Tritrichomonas foetus]|uniref:BAR domain-containing protein n=1 Tax=Tritrichomonas foetus TaxID=1144522 RepID=A0A1J4K2Y7_9EUKA|nr:hypothetical protein TRFO_26964 [Tritrichomonas foetus]|eukprot:OHT05330.1 hypothetical protein TRFO_26964 [Tritrichomonas foetus]
MKLFQKLTSVITKDGFPEYNAFTESLETIRKSEVLMIDGLYKGYSENLSKYAQTQLSGVVEPLNDLKEAGSQTRNIIKEAYEPLSTLPNDVKPLLDQHTEMARWRDLCKKAEEQAKKSEAAAEKAELNLNKAKITGKPGDIAKAESNYSIAKRKFDDDTKSYQDQKDSLEKKEQPYRVKFLELYVTPINAALDLRIKEAEKLGNIVSDYQAAVEKFHDVENDDSIEQLRTELAKFKEIVIE